MNVLPFASKDCQALQDIHARFGYRWPFPASTDNYYVVRDETGQILMAAGWKLTPEVTLLCDPDKSLHPLVKLKGIAMLHEKIGEILMLAGHTEAISFVAPELGSFARHLQREFNWQAEWPALRHHLRKEP